MNALSTDKPILARNPRVGEVMAEPEAWKLGDFQDMLPNNAPSRDLAVHVI